MFSLLKMFFMFLGILLILSLSIFILVSITYLGISLFSEDGYLFGLLAYKLDGKNNKDLIPEPNNIIEYLFYKIFISKKDEKGDKK